MVKNNIIKIYNTGLKSKSEIENEFVVRTKEFEIIMEDVESSDMIYPEQDYLIIGERGMGKTMLLTRIKFSIQANIKLSKWLIAVNFSEEQNNVTQLYDVWLNIAKFLDYNFPFEFKNLYKQLFDLPFNEYTEENAFRILNDQIIKNKRKLLLLIDNFDSILNTITEKESRRLREILISNNNIRIIAASSKAVEYNYRYDKAFYEHFVELKLKGLNKQEVKLLLKSICEKLDLNKNYEKLIKDKNNKIETLRQLSGGNIRNMILFFKVLISNANNNLFTDLEFVLEQITPYNIDKVKSLKPQQRKIVDFLAKSWDGTYTNEIAQACKMKSNEVAAQLKSLEENQIVSSKSSKFSRKKIYFIKDRFFNIWYLLRINNQLKKEKVIKLINLFELYYQVEQEESCNNIVEENFDLSFDALLLIKSNEFKKAFEEFDSFLNMNRFNNYQTKDAIQFFLIAISKNQLYLCLNLFEKHSDSNSKNSLKEKYKPIWFVLMYYLQHDYKNEFLRMGDEIKELVFDMIKEVERLKKLD